jgi:ring-1,2-phenylacetyl-CoA epoxidase subunit PaaD
VAVGGVHRRPAERSGGDLVSEAGTQVAIARARAGAVRLTSHPDPDLVAAALAEVMDPELPVLSIVDLGIVHRVAVGPDGIAVAILPTFVGCPALDMIRSSIVDRLGTFGVPVDVTTTFEVAWTSDRISPAGRAALARVGIAPPGQADAVTCPMCQSPNVVQDSLFGPTQCRSLYYCRACRQPFEAIKPV